jgi:hypothetical protein
MQIVEGWLRGHKVACGQPMTVSLQLTDSRRLAAHFVAGRHNGEERARPARVVGILLFPSLLLS